MNKIIKFWSDSYHSDPIAFYFELASFVFVVIATVLIAVNAKSPNMLTIYPFFLLSSSTALVAHIRRKLAWPFIASSYFVCINVVGLIRTLI